MTERQVHPGEQHPEEWQRDLNPDSNAGQNRGLPEAEFSDAPTAYEVKGVHRQFHGFSDDDIWDIAGITALFGLSNRIANVISMRPNDEFYMMGRDFG